MEARACRHCGKAFEPIKANQLYCCPDHERTARQERNRVKPEPKPCAGCGQIFLPYRNSQKYGPDCDCRRQAHLQKQGRQQLPQRSCCICGTQFTPRRDTQITCNSPVCRSERQRILQRASYQALAALTKPSPQVLVIRDVAPEERAVYAFDFHVPFHDQRLVSPFLNFLKDFQPHRIFIPGDFYDHYSISRFDRSPTRGLVLTLGNELEDGRILLGQIRKAAPDADVYFEEGNHERRLRDLIWRESALESLKELEPQQLYGLSQFNIEWLPFGSYISYLGFMIEHGCIVRARSAYTAWGERQRHGSSGISGHVHRRGQHSWTDERGSHTWIEAGCMCRLDPEWLPHPDWQQGFVVSTVHHSKLHLTSVAVYPEGFRVEGAFYER